MGKYATRQMYLDCDEQLPGTALLAPLTIERAIRRAESLIDRYIGFDPRLGGFEPHSCFYQHAWDKGRLRTYIASMPVPIRVVQQYKIVVAPSFGTTIAANDIAYNAYSNYVEIVPVQTITFGLAPIFDIYGLHPPIVQVDYLAGYMLLMTNDVLINSGDNLTYIARHGFWEATNTLATQLQPQTPLPIPATVLVNGSIQTSGYSNDLIEGRVTFSVARLATDKITANYVYSIPESVTDATLAQTTELLAQRNLNRQGLHGLEEARNTDQSIRRARVQRGEHESLCNEALERLQDFIPAALG